MIVQLIIIGFLLAFLIYAIEKKTGILKAIKGHLINREWYWCYLGIIVIGVSIWIAVIANNRFYSLFLLLCILCFIILKKRRERKNLEFWDF